MNKTLLIVESAKKARTIKGILGRGYDIRATSGHILEMPSGDLQVDLQTFLPTLHLIRGKGKRLQQLQQAAAKADQIYLATDLDREGEAIAQHVVDRLGSDLAGRMGRITFTAITEPDLRAALAQPRAIDHHLVEAQTARRVIDRLVGYMVSPVLWAGLTGRKGLSAGRVQSPALWLVVDRERQIKNFVVEEWWSVEAELSKTAEGPAGERFWAQLYRIDGQKPALKHAEAAHQIKQALETAAWRVASVAKSRRTRRPYPPFTTDSLQQAASSQLGLGPKITMSLAQQLYEGIDVGQGKAVGLITYLRTDSLAVAPEAQQAAREVVKRYWGAAYLPKQPPNYKTGDKTAQEAHEAIRPTDPWRTPKQLQPYLSPQQYQLYRLIWRRFIASQMKPALYDTVSVDIETFVKTDPGEPKIAAEPSRYLFRARGSSLRFAGFLKVYGVDEDAETARATAGRPDDDSSDETPSVNRSLPDLREKDWLTLHQLVPKQHFTKPPDRYTEAGLIGQLKKRGLGRPSTYATIVETLKQRRYVQLQQKRMWPTPLGIQVCELLEEHIALAVDVDFTARMEADLDAIAAGTASRLERMQTFYGSFKTMVDQALSEARQNRRPAAQASALPAKGGAKSGRTGSSRKRTRSNWPVSERAGQPCPQCQQGQLLVRRSKFGFFLGCSRFDQDKACRYTEKLPESQAKAGKN